MSAETCETCRYSRGADVVEDDPYLECRRRSSTAWVAKWTLVRPDDWCGEHERTSPVSAGVVVPLRHDLASWLRGYAEMAERGELVAVAIATVKADQTTSTAWHDDQGHAAPLLGSIHILAHRVVARLVDP